MSRFFGNLKTCFSSVMVVLLAMSVFEVEAQQRRLSNSEVEALKEVARELGKKDWNFTVDPCSNDTSWVTPDSDQRPFFNNSVTCNCSFPGGECHIVTISLDGQDLDGVLPRSVAKLSNLTSLYLHRNYLSGNIPSDWASMKLENLSLSANRLTGQIPSFLGNIKTLRVLYDNFISLYLDLPLTAFLVQCDLNLEHNLFRSLETNMFSGTVPPELGNLVNLETLILSANNLNGTLPVSFTNLTKLRELRISSNNFIGKLPNYFQSWKNLQKLEIQASGFEGPIPSSIVALSGLTELRISDLYGEGSDFPSLEHMTEMNKLMLRNSNISGSLQPFFTAMPNLKILDLSFNRLRGNLSEDFEEITRMENVYLTSNLLSGPIPDWLKFGDTRAEIDLSRNNFSESTLPPNCRDTLNLFKSTSGGNNSKPAECLRNYVCSEDRYSLHINCGGAAIKIGSISYEADEETVSAAKYIPNKETWEISNTGHFWDKGRSSNDYIAQNSSILRMENPELYTGARVSPLSLSYYARCLGKGNYSVKLHFSEIVMRDNRSYYSVGKRIFDVYIQEQLVLKDFNIAEEARGVDKAIIREFKAVLVKDGSLEIRFQWAGKGTTAVPIRGTYGPLISAIDVESEFKPPDSGENKRKKLIVAGAVILPLLLIFIIAGILWRKGYFRGKEAEESELLGLDLNSGRFTFKQIKAATNNFNQANKLGAGGFGTVYKGTLKDGTLIAVKQLSSRSKQGNQEFLNEIGMISVLQHPNVVRLYGCCVERNQLLLVYEYMENNSVAHALFETDHLLPKLDWPMRKSICIGVAKGLAFLHEESALKIVHRDIKTANILLDGDLNAKISDFGLAKLDDDDNTHISTRVAGTIGYMAPEYALWGYLTHKADVYSFGVVALEIISGKNNMKYRPDENFVCLVDWAFFLQQKGNILDLVDPRLGSELKKEEAIRISKVAVLCTSSSPALRPTMSEVVGMLEGRTPVPEVVMGTGFYGDDLRSRGPSNHYDHISFESSSESQSLIHSSEVTQNGSSSISGQYHNAFHHHSQ